MHHSSIDFELYTTADASMSIKLGQIGEVVVQMRLVTVRPLTYRSVADLA